MSGAPVTTAQLLTLLEAARWAPSGGNGQPWRFAYALAGTPHFERFLATLVPGNREWCVRAGALVLLSAKVVRDDGKPRPRRPSTPAPPGWGWRCRGRSPGWWSTPWPASTRRRRGWRWRCRRGWSRRR